MLFVVADSAIILRRAMDAASIGIMGRFWRVVAVLGVLLGGYWVTDLIVDGWSLGGVLGVALGASWLLMGLVYPWKRKRRERAARDAI